MWLSRKNGFTLIELLIVIAVLGVLSAGVLVAINPLGKLQQARDSIRKSDIRVIVSALESYYVMNLRYPCFSGPSDCGWTDASYAGALITSGELKIIPTDPVSKNGCPGYLLSFDNIASKYTIFSKLENSNDSDALKTKSAPISPPPGSTSDSYKTYLITSGSCSGYTYNYWINSK